MTTSLNDVRIAVMDAFKVAHYTNYPGMKVNFPNLTVVDLQHQTLPFVSLELDLTGIEKAALGERELLVPGILNVYYYYQDNTGTIGASTYTDILNEFLCDQQIGEIYYGIAKPRDVQTFPGWKGSLNAIRFDLSSGVTC